MAKRVRGAAARRAGRAGYLPEVAKWVRGAAGRRAGRAICYKRQGGCAEQLPGGPGGLSAESGYLLKVARPGFQRGARAACVFCAKVAVLLGTPTACAVRARVRCAALAVVLRRRFGHALGAVHVVHKIVVNCDLTKQRTFGFLSRSY